MPQRLGISCKACLFFNIFSGDLYFDALIIRLFQISLAMGQSLGEGTFQKVLVGMSRERWGVSLAWGLAWRRGLPMGDWG